MDPTGLCRGSQAEKNIEESGDIINRTPKTLSVTECHQLLDALLVKDCTPTQFRKGVRNHTMALLMLDAGLRVGEVVALLISDLYFGGVPVSGLIIRPEIAKTKTERTVPLSERIRNALVLHAEQIKDEQPDYVPCFFHAYKRGFRIMTTRQVERIIRTAALKSIGRPIHPHMLRHTFATRIWRKAGERITQELLGHQNVASTQIYTHPNQDDLKKAIDQLGQGEIETGLPPTKLAT